MTEHVLPIRAQDRWFAVDAAPCVQIIGDAAWLPVSHRGSAVRGLYFWRRSALPVVDPMEGAALQPWTLAPRLVIVRTAGGYCALACDEARETTPVAEQVPLDHPFGDKGVPLASGAWPLITARGLAARLEKDCGLDPLPALPPEAALVFQVGPVDIAVPAALVERIANGANGATLDPKVTLDLPSYEELTLEKEQGASALMCRVGGREVSILVQSEIRMADGHAGHSIRLPRFANSTQPLPTQAILGWGRRPAILLEERYLHAYLERACP